MGVSRITLIAAIVFTAGYVVVCTTSLGNKFITEKTKEMSYETLKENTFKDVASFLFKRSRDAFVSFLEKFIPLNRLDIIDDIDDYISLDVNECENDCEKEIVEK